MKTPRKLELVCPAGTPAALKTAVESGADSVYLGFRDETNARNFPGLNFDRDELAEGIEFAHANGVKVLVAINTYPRAGNLAPWHAAVDDAARMNADAVILADIGLLDYAANKHPNLRRHLSVQAAASTPEAINFYADTFGVKRVVVPRVLSVPEIGALNREISVETEVFAFGGLCVMAEGRCLLSSHACGMSPNMNGVCSPASAIRYIEQDGKLTAKLGNFTLNIFPADEAAGYPTTCKGRYLVNGKESYVFAEPESLNAMTVLKELSDAGVTALKIEGRQRGRAYVAQVVSAFRKAVDALAEGKPLPPTPLASVTEGGRETGGAYKKEWQ